MKAMSLIGAIAVVLGLAGVAAQAAPSPWEQPTAALAAKVAGILGPGQAHVTIQNLSTIPADQLPVIQQLLQQDLQARGVTDGGPQSISSVRVTLSEDARERLWVAEVIEGSQTQVAMVRLAQDSSLPAQAQEEILLRKQAIFTARATLLAALETPDGMVVLEPEQIAVYTRTADGWTEQKRVAISRQRPLTRDPRGILAPTAGGTGFDAWLPGVHCAGSDAPDPATGDWAVQCQENDDPWTIPQAAISQAAGAPPATAANGGAPLQAFFNASRDYFMGVVIPSAGVELPPFYSAALIPRPLSGTALLIGGIDGTVKAAENGALSPVDGTGDWGSDFATFSAACGAGTEIVASGAGDAANDSLRAYELHGLEVTPTSAPLAMDGTVMALWTAPDGKSVLATVRDSENGYEVDRVTALCN